MYVILHDFSLFTSYLGNKIKAESFHDSLCHYAVKEGNFKVCMFLVSNWTPKTQFPQRFQKIDHNTWSHFFESWKQSLILKKYA